MSVFVTGATGYIGNRLVRRLISEGNRVHALCRNINSPDLSGMGEALRIFAGDITDPGAVRLAMTGCSEVYHLAALARVWSRDPSVFETINAGGTRIVLETARQLGVRKIVFTSTAGVLGPSGDRPVREEDERIGAPMNDYERSKTDAEALCRFYVQEYQMDIVIVNPPRVYGPGIGSESNAVTRLLRLYMAGRWRILPGDGEGIGSYVYIDDVVNGHLLAMKRGRSGERYILGGVNASYRKFFESVAMATGRRRKLIRLPLAVMMLAGHVMMWRTALFGKPPLLTPAWIKKYQFNWALDSSKAIRELGYSYLSLDAGLKKTICWLRSGS